MILQKIYHQLDEWIIMLNSPYFKDTDAELVQEEMKKLMSEIWLNKDKELINSSNLKEAICQETKSNTSTIQKVKVDSSPDTFSTLNEVLEDIEERISECLKDTNKKKEEGMPNGFDWKAEALGYKTSLECIKRTREKFKIDKLKQENKSNINKIILQDKQENKSKIDDLPIPKNHNQRMYKFGYDTARQELEGLKQENKSTESTLSALERLRKENVNCVGMSKDFINGSDWCNNLWKIKIEKELKQENKSKDFKINIGTVDLTTLKKGCGKEFIDKDYGN